MKCLLGGSWKLLFSKGDEPLVGREWTFGGEIFTGVLGE